MSNFTIFRDVHRPCYKVQTGISPPHCSDPVKHWPTGFPHPSVSADSQRISSWEPADVLCPPLLPPSRDPSWLLLGPMIPEAHRVYFEDFPRKASLAYSVYSKVLAKMKSPAVSHLASGEMEIVNECAAYNVMSPVSCNNDHTQAGFII